MQGYLVLALDKQKYFDMAAYLAMSIRLFDPDRPICLLHNAAITLPEGIDRLFDHVICLPERSGVVGVMNKVQVYDHTPFEETMAVDADCVMMKPGIDVYWDQFAPHDFNLLGEKIKSGIWKEKNVATIIKKMNIPHIIKMNAGVFYFRKNEGGKRFYDRMAYLLDNHLDDISHYDQGRKGQYSIEPIIGVAMVQEGIEPLSVDHSVGSLMVSTWRSRNVRFDIDAQTSQLEKMNGFWGLPLPILARNWVRHSPIFAHFIGLEPKGDYHRLVTQLRERFPAIAPSIGFPHRD